MNTIATFHKSVRGANHIAWEKPCEDASGSYANEERHYYITAVADGHGADECFRAQVGSQIAVEVAMTCLREFADGMTSSPVVEARFYLDMLTNPRYCRMTIRRLTDIIYTRWYDGVIAHLQENPPTEEELAQLGDKTNYAQKGEPQKIYGSTIMAALWMKECLILVHQGDGRCDVFFEDGTVTQPIPWDKRCVGTQTTSLCDSDVENSFRSCVLDFKKKAVAACYLGCDGVEDAYRDSEETMEGVHTFYKGLTCEVAARSAEELEQYLTDMLPSFSLDGLYGHAGSGDDISVAGIVDVQAVKPFVEQFHRDTQVYTLREELFWKNDAVRSKTRKHGILQRRLNESQAALQQAETQVKDLQRQREDTADDLERKKISLEKLVKADDAFHEQAQIMNEGQPLVEDPIMDFLKQIPGMLDLILDGVSKEGLQRTGNRQKAEKSVQAMEEKLAALDADLERKKQELQQRQAEQETNLRAFQEYDTLYQKSEADADKAKQALEKLLNDPLEKQIPDENVPIE